MDPDKTSTEKTSTEKNSTDKTITEKTSFEEADFDKVNADLFAFLERSPVPCFAIWTMRDILLGAGFEELGEADAWELEAGGAYFTVRNDAALIAFRIPRRDFTGFQIVASHCDSPLFKVKPNAEIEVDGKYTKLNVEKYGGMLCAPWMDRPLSVAGRIAVETRDGIRTLPVNVDRDLLIIPNLAVHMDRTANDGHAWNVQKDMLPLFCEAGQEPGTHAFLSLIAREAGVREEEILDADLFLYNRMKPARIGLSGEFIAAPRLDDLQCAFASLQGILAAEPGDSVAVHCVFDNEEVGSGSRQGAAGTFLQDVLYRISRGMGHSREEYLRALASSFMVSADNAHSLHPNHADRADPVNRPRMNGGIVIKYSANQKYTTDAVSGALFRALCKKGGIPVQTFTNRSDMAGGSTLGNIAQSQVSVCTVDVGLAQLAMHSPCETAGARDTAYLMRAARMVFSSSVEASGTRSYRLMWGQESSGSGSCPRAKRDEERRLRNEVFSHFRSPHRAEADQQGFGGGPGAYPGRDHTAGRRGKAGRRRDRGGYLR